MAKKILKKISFIGACLLVLSISYSCKKDKDDDKDTKPTVVDEKWITAYKNVTLGNQGNPNYGPFFKPQTGEVLKLGQTAGIEEFIGMVFFSSYGNQTYFTFPADAEAADAYPHPTNPIFVDNPNGLNYWAQPKMVNGMITKPNPDISIITFNQLATSLDAVEFDKTFRYSNLSYGEPQEFLAYEVSYELSPDAGQVYLAQFNKSVRAIILVKNVVEATNGSITFDILIESRKSYESLDLTKNIQPKKKVD